MIGPPASDFVAATKTTVTRNYEPALSTNTCEEIRKSTCRLAMRSGVLADLAGVDGRWPSLRRWDDGPARVGERLAIR